MPRKLNFDSVLSVSDEIVVREIDGEFLLVPLGDGIGDMENELFALNSTGQAIWKKLDGKSSLRQITVALSKEYKASPRLIEGDILGLVRELVKRKILIEAK